jgi:hypothetical protein
MAEEKMSEHLTKANAEASCGVIDNVLLEISDLAKLNGLPVCEIRPSCR